MPKRHSDSITFERDKRDSVKNQLSKRKRREKKKDTSTKHVSMHVRTERKKRQRGNCRKSKQML